DVEHDTAVPCTCVYGRELHAPRLLGLTGLVVEPLVWVHTPPDPLSRPVLVPLAWDRLRPCGDDLAVGRRRVRGRWMDAERSAISGEVAGLPREAARALAVDAAVLSEDVLPREVSVLHVLEDVPADRFLGRPLILGKELTGERTDHLPRPRVAELGLNLTPRLEVRHELVVEDVRPVRIKPAPAALVARGDELRLLVRRRIAHDRFDHELLRGRWLRAVHAPVRQSRPMNAAVASSERIPSIRATASMLAPSSNALRPAQAMTDRGLISLLSSRDSRSVSTIA